MFLAQTDVAAARHDPAFREAFPPDAEGPVDMKPEPSRVGWN